MKLPNPSRRPLLIGIAATLAFGVIAVVVLTAVVLWRLTEWGSETVNQLTEAATAVVAPLREDAQRAVTETKATVANSVAAVANPQEELRRAVADASSSVAQVKERAAQVLGEHEAVVRNLGEATAQDASQTVAAAAASIAPVVAGHLEAAQALIPRVARDPTTWPEGLALKQIHYRQAGDVTEYSYLAAVPAFDLKTLREQLIGLGYAEHVLAEGEGTLEAVYRGEHQLLLSATTLGSEQRIDVRELPKAGP